MLTSQLFSLHPDTSILWVLQILSLYQLCTVPADWLPWYQLILSDVSISVSIYIKLHAPPCLDTTDKCLVFPTKRKESRHDANLQASCFLINLFHNKNDRWQENSRTLQRLTFTELRMKITPGTCTEFASFCSA